MCEAYRLPFSLSVTKPTPTVLAEKEFIEATSKIYSYGVKSRPGVPLPPIKIRSVKTLKNDVAAEVKALAMLADAATQAEDFFKAAELSEHMVRTTRLLRETVLRPTTSDEALPTEEDAQEAQDAVEPEFPDVKKKLALLGSAMQLCPAENVLDVLAIWRTVENEAIDERGRPRTGPN
ncbi:hypothetical protein FRC01_002655, partial [Tulasnella sp. 417]